MPLFDVFKKKFKEDKSSFRPSPFKKGSEKEEKVVEKKPLPPKQNKKILGEAYKVLKSPHVTEKASDLVGQNQYVFKVWEGSNKKEVKRAVEDVFGVEVVSVRVVNIPKKKIRIGRTEGTKSGYKKAIVKIRKDQKIEILPR